MQCYSTKHSYLPRVVSFSSMSVRMQRICSKQQKYRGGHKTSEESNESPTAGGIYWNNVSACLSLQHFFHLMPLSFLPETKTRRKRPRKKKWYQPWLDHASGITDFHLECKKKHLKKTNFSLNVFVLLTVLHSGDYYLFESDSEGEEELQSEGQQPQKQTAYQVRQTPDCIK